MARLTADTVVGVLGGGAMGSGIAQLAAAHGHAVVVGDASPIALERARRSVVESLAREVKKGRMSEAGAAATRDRITYGLAGVHEGVELFRGCGLVIEAIVEALEPKRESLALVEQVLEPEAVLGTNTSSLSITAIAERCACPNRVLGIHFFNPAPIMRLVEVVPGVATDAAVVADARAFVERWGKTTVLASDTPGFIVNRIARPFYGEAWRLVEEGAASAATVDWAMRELGGFRMGPFELMDFIGHDVNFAVTRSVFEGFFFEPRYRPSLSQQRLVEAGWLGRKTSRGVYDHLAATPPAPDTDRTRGQAIVERIVALLINEAADAVRLGVATASDVDLAMTTGVNYPHGLLAWADAIGVPQVLARLAALHEEYGEERYRPSPLLRRMAREGRRFFP